MPNATKESEPTDGLVSMVHNTYAIFAKYGGQLTILMLIATGLYAYAVKLQTEISPAYRIMSNADLAGLGFAVIGGLIFAFAMWRTCKRDAAMRGWKL